MKKIFYLASIAALAFSSCAKDETTEVALDTVGGGKIVAEMSGNADTRAYLDANHKFNWQNGDKLAVYNSAVEHPMFNSAYSWKNGFTQGVFEGEKKFNANEAYLAVYPRFSTSLITTGDLANMWAVGYVPGGPYGAYGTYLKLDANDKATGVKLSIPAEQKYMPGSFYQDVVPAMSTTFDVQANGDAAIKMQPVADYLFVNIKATEPIEKLTLKLFDRNASDFLNIAGEGNPTAYLLNGDVRYYLSAGEMDEEAITLVTNDYAADVTCHEPQTYVFVVPGGILGTVANADIKTKGIEAWIWVNDADTTDPMKASFAATTHEDSIPSLKTAGVQVVSNAQMNGYYSNNGTPSITQDDIYIARGAEADQTKVDPHGVLAAKNMEMENKYFWVNPLSKGQRTSFTYNPSDADVIENEAQLLRYLTKYEDGSKKVNAYICDNHTFDFSEAHMKQLSSELKANGSYTEFQPYIDAYLNGSFPTITEFEHVFNGNNAVISGIVEPLKGMGGIFGEIKGTIKDVTFDGIVAAEMDAEAPKGKMYPGVILGSVNGATISNVAVKNAEGMAIFGKATTTVLSKVAIEGVEDLNFIVVDMDLNGSRGTNDFTKTWSAWSGVKKAVFGTLDANGYGTAYLPEGADYAKLAWYVSTADATLADGIGAIVGGKNSFVAKAANQADTNAVSVMIGETSIWTGDVAETHTYGGYHTSNTNHAYYNYQCIESAEELAGTVAGDAILMTDMDMSYAVNSWETPDLDGTLEGNGATIKGISMEVEGVTTFVGSSVAPFEASKVYNLIVDGVSIDIFTKAGQVVYQHIAGLAKDANRVENVTVKNLVITGDGSSNNNEQYSNEYPSYIGWLVAGANNPTIKNSKVEGVNNSIAGIAALVGYVFITDNNSAKFENATATSVTTPQEQLANFWDFNGGRYDESKHGNFAATAVGLVDNSTSSAKSIEFAGTTGKPVFLYRNTENGDINVLYDDSKVILKKGDKQYK